MTRADDILNEVGATWNEADPWASALVRLRALHEWSRKGSETRVRELFDREGLNSDQMRTVVLNFCSTKPHTLRLYRDYAEAIEQRIVMIRRDGQMPVEADREDPQRKRYGSFGPCWTCGEPSSSSGWAGMYCATHFRMAHQRDVSDGKIDELPQSDTCDKCGALWTLLCDLGKFCREHSDGVITACVGG